MDKVGQILVTAQDLRRKIWASLPWNLRIAELIYRLAFVESDAEAFGIGIYTGFLLKHVKGMPDINGKTAEEVTAGMELNREDFRRLASKLPRRYGADFGGRVVKTLLAKKMKLDIIENAMSEYLVYFIDKGVQHLEEGAPLPRAQNYVIEGVKNRYLNMVNKAYYRREISDTYEDDDSQEKKREIAVAPDVDTLTDAVSENALLHELPKLTHTLEAIHKDAPLYVKLVLTEGIQDKTFLNEYNPTTSAGKPISTANWDATYKPKILKVLKHHFEELS